jgi:hypothetical protein
VWVPSSSKASAKAACRQAFSDAGSTSKTELGAWGVDRDQPVVDREPPSRQLVARARVTGTAPGRHGAHGGGSDEGGGDGS